MTDLGGVIESRWITDRRGAYAGSGWERHGVLGEWGFTHAHLRQYRADDRFAYLDTALRADPPGDWHGRMLTALRTMNIATVRERPAIRIMLYATALEALVGDPFRAGGATGGRGHLLARRAAYFACGSENDPPGLHRPARRPACEFLTRTRDPRGDARLYHPTRRVWACSDYGDMRNLYDDRNAALHGAAAGFDQRRAASHEFHLDRVVREALRWVIDRQPTSIVDLDDEIASLPAA
jgi:hypothetical protein